jgi:curved DNA-binding protein CbpA
MDDDAQREIGNRRAVLAALEQILDARSLETLFAGLPDEAALLYDVLEEAARGVHSSCYWEVCRTARRRHLTPEFVVDRAAVLLASIQERRKWDLYRVLDVPPLSQIDVIHQRFRDLAKQEHPDVGGDGARFRRLKEAYDVLKDDGRRGEYEAFWARALGPFERTRVVRPTVEIPEPPAMEATAPVANTTTAPATVTEVMDDAAVERTPTPPAAAEAHAREEGDADVRLRRVAALFREWDDRVFASDDVDRQPGGRVLRLAADMAGAVEASPADLARRCGELDDLLGQFERIRAQLATIAWLKAQVADRSLAG